MFNKYKARSQNQVLVVNALLSTGLSSKELEEAVGDIQKFQQQARCDEERQENRSWSENNRKERESERARYEAHELELAKLGAKIVRKGRC